MCSLRRWQAIKVREPLAPMSCVLMFSVRVALINYIDDPTGNNDYTAAIAVGGTFDLPGTTPTKVFVK